MTERFYAEALYDAGFTDLVSVIPPGAQLAPSSSINQSQTGKCPGRRLPNGLWAGYDWRNAQATVDDVRRWVIDGANIGMRADRFPGVDIDCTDARLARMIEECATQALGPAPRRIGRAPKALLMYRTDEPFSRMRLFIKQPNGEQHLVEILGKGQQYLMHGTHPSTLRPYEWNTDLTAGCALTTITRESAAAFLDTLEGMLNTLDIGTVQREGDGRRGAAGAAADQAGLVAPSLELLRNAVACIPNDDEFAPQRDDYIRMGIAIRAAAGDDHDEGFAIFAGWAGSRPPDGRVAGNPETWLSDWRRFKAPYAVGWNWLADHARARGFSDATLDFDAVEAAPSEGPSAAPQYSDQWLAERVVERRRDVLRYIPQEGKYICWDQKRWQRDAELLAEDIVKRELRRIANETERVGATKQEKAKAQERAIAFCSAGKATAVAQLLRSDRAIAVSMTALDHDPWLLNTPEGIVDLRTGVLSPADPDALCTKMTAVPPDFGGACPNWKRFLAEATANDRELEAYLQRLAGYCLTGSTREQHLSFIHGPGGNGKGTYKNAIEGIMADYAVQADMATFTATNGDRHTTDLAMLVGARLVTASETEAGKRWDETRLKSLTGGDIITARFMRQDNFHYKPQFKLVFIGNHKPEVREVDEAMRRRIQMVPFTVKPAVVDRELDDKLRDEWPAILAWMIEGCLAWQQRGLDVPPIVRAATQEYFRDEDAVGRWLAERCTLTEDGRALSEELYASWREWANQHGEWVGSMKRLSAALIRRLERWQDPTTRRMGFRGVSIDQRQDIGVL